MGECMNGPTEMNVEKLGSSSGEVENPSEAEMRATYADEDFPRRILIFHVS